jgi:hypothetical protein
MFGPLKIARIGGLISLPKLLCEKNVLVYGFVGMGGLNFSKNCLVNFFVMAHGNWRDIW